MTGWGVCGDRRSGRKAGRARCKRARPLGTRYKRAPTGLAVPALVERLDVIAQHVRQHLIGSFAHHMETGSLAGCQQRFNRGDGFAHQAGGITVRFQPDEELFGLAFRRTDLQPDRFVLAGEILPGSRDEPRVLARGRAHGDAHDLGQAIRTHRVGILKRRAVLGAAGIDV